MLRPYTPGVCQNLIRFCRVFDDRQRVVAEKSADVTLPDPKSAGPCIVRLSSELKVLKVQDGRGRRFLVRLSCELKVLKVHFFGWQPKGRLAALDTLISPPDERVHALTLLSLAVPWGDHPGPPPTPPDVISPIPTEYGNLRAHHPLRLASPDIHALDQVNPVSRGCIGRLRTPTQTSDNIITVSFIKCADNTRAEESILFTCLRACGRRQVRANLGRTPPTDNRQHGQQTTDNTRQTQKPKAERSKPTDKPPKATQPTHAHTVSYGR